MENCGVASLLFFIFSMHRYLLAAVMFKIQIHQYKSSTKCFINFPFSIFNFQFTRGVFTMKNYSKAQIDTVTAESKNLGSFAMPMCCCMCCTDTGGMILRVN